MSQSSSQTHALQSLTDPGELIILPAGATRSDVVRLLAKSSPQNEYKLPMMFYRSDLLPDTSLGYVNQSDTDASVVHLDYSEGYPTYHDGKIFWFQLPHEPLDSYLLFQRFIEQAETEGLRQLQLLSQQESISLGRMSQLFYEYYWPDRARSYDLFQVAADRKRRASRARRTEDAHFNLADELLTRVKQKLAQPEFLDSLDAKDAIDVLMQLAKLQRMSLGLSANGNQGNAPIDPLAASTGSDLMKEITRNVNRDESAGLGSALQELMSDPNFALEAQSLVLRVRRQESMSLPEQSAARLVESGYVDDLADKS